VAKVLAKNYAVGIKNMTYFCNQVHFIYICTTNSFSKQIFNTFDYLGLELEGKAQFRKRVAQRLKQNFI